MINYPVTSMQLNNIEFASDFEFFPAKFWAKDVESKAMEQLYNVANMPFIHKHIAVMPDVHLGKGATVGSVIPTIKAVIPAAVGVDIGCGMCAIPTNLTANDLPDNLKYLRDSIEYIIPVGSKAHPNYDHLNILEDEVTNLTISMPVGYFHVYGVQFPRQGTWNQLGTLGGGNHFIELCLDESDNVWIMLHSGSRGIGNRIGQRFIELAKKDMENWLIDLPDKDLAYIPEASDYFDPYIRCVEWAQNYAVLNRKVMLHLVIGVMKTHFPQMIVDLENRAVSCHHNYIARENHYGQNCYVTRKGAVRARKGDLGIIPGSMGTKSYIVEGLGNEESFCSCSHGAGRVMSRTEAKKRISLEEHAEATKGIECRKDEGVIDESPAAYKDIDEVMEIQKDLVRPIHTLHQVMCIKG